MMTNNSLLFARPIVKANSNFSFISGDCNSIGAKLKQIKNIKHPGNLLKLMLCFCMIHVVSGVYAQTPNNGGGGGTFVVKQAGNVPLIIAGGGGGASGQCCGNGDADGRPGVITTSGTNGIGNTSSPDGTGGTGGNGGGSGSPNGAGGGGGFNTNGANGTAFPSQVYGGSAFLNGGMGGIGIVNCGAMQQASGGFGGGGGSSHNGSMSWVNGRGAGGGGYSGGGAAIGTNNWGAGGGGGSYNIGSAQANYDGSNASFGNNGDGTVIITWAGGSQTFVKVHNTLQYFTVPAGVSSINIIAKGAKGGNSAVVGSYNHVGGKGAYMSGNFSVTPGDILVVLVGEAPEPFSGICCANPSAFSVTGGGTYCAGGTGLAIGLNGSQTGVNYQLKLNGVDSGSPLAGTGGSISFGLQTAAGTYTVQATNASSSSCTATMSGSRNITVNSSEINVQGNSITIVDSDNSPSLTDHTDFGAVDPGGNIVRTFTIQNTGTSVLNISGVTVTGGDASLFTVGALSPASPVAAGNAATFSVTFAPTSAGVKTTTVHIASNDCDEPDYDYAIKGTACTINSWLGTAGSDWFNPANWSCGVVPTAATDVIIPSAAPACIIPAGPAAEVHNLTIQSGASLTNNGTLTIASGGVVTHSGTFTNNGTFNQ